VITATNKWLLISESCDDSNLCIPYGGRPNQHTKCFPRSIHVGSKTIRISHGQYITTFHTSVNRFEQIHCPWDEWLPNIIHNTPADRSMGPYSLLSYNSQWSSGKSQAFVDIRLLGLPGPYHRHAIGTFNTCLRGATHRSLEVPACHIPLPDLPNQLSPLSPKGPNQSLV
jgi:hypothetical protein